MFLDDADGMLELLRGALPYYVLVFVPLLIVISPMTPVLGAHEFTVYRMQQFDLHSTPHGCRSSMVNVEARSIHSQVYTRRCILARLTDVTQAQFQEIVQQGAGGLLILLSSNYSTVSNEERQHIMELEHMLLDEEVNIPVYFAIETPELTEIYDGVHRASSDEKSGTATEELMAVLTASGFQMVITGSQAKPQNDMQIATIQGKLSGFGVEEHLPTVVVVAHYDAFSVAPAMSFGADSNGSGVAALLELARLLSRLYTSSRTHPRFNVLFLLSGGGKFNFQGTKKWIEDNIDSSEGSLLPDALFTLCLDSVGTGDHLYLHVSKPPKEGSVGHTFFKDLQSLAAQLHPELNVTMIHKKINLADEMLSWEHERFSIRRLPAFTLSHFDSPRAPSHSSILDTRNNVDVDKLARNVKVIAEALARHIYNLTNEESAAEVFTNSLAVQKDFLEAWIDHLTAQPRSAQILATGHPRHPLVSTLEQAMARYLKEIRISVFKPDKREPELVFYEPVKAVMNAYSVKPAVFDLFLAVAISAYLALVYLLVTNFHRLASIMKQVSTPLKPKVS